MLFAALLLLGGCDSSLRPGDREATDKVGAAKVKTLANPVGTLKLSSSKRQWDDAWGACEVILSEAGINPAALEQATDDQFAEIESDTLLLMARAAYETGRTDQSTCFLRFSCQNQSYQDPARVRQAMIAMISDGHYYDGLAFLGRALDAQPDQHETRRWLFDFYIGADDRVSALPHGRQLVLDRQFDLDLLTALSSTERRTLDAKPLDQMVTRNPNDKRPLLGAAKTKFDESKYDEAIRILKEIGQTHPNDHPSQAMLGQSYAAAGRFDELETWASMQTVGIENYPGYWIALGDWARWKGDRGEAIRAFAQAATCGDPDVVQIYTRLATLLPEFTAAGQGVSKELVTAVNDRAKQLSRFHQLKDRFKRTGSISRAIALEIAQSLVKLGRLWEAEAWSAIATTLPEDDAIDVAAFRRELVEQLRPGTPWRLPNTLPDFASVLENFPLPSIEKIVSTGDPQRTGNSVGIAGGSDAATMRGKVVDWKLANEGVARGLRFWGRTGDSLDQPGIMLYQTLGCGGGTIDFDLDGWSDLYLVAAGGRPPHRDSASNELFRNVAGQFQPVASVAGTADRGFGQGVAVGDVNEDGFPDVLVLNYGPNRLYVNRGDGTFRDAGDLLPTERDDEWSSSGAIADIDQDGLSDIVIVNYCATLGPVTQTCPMKDSDMIRSCTPMLFSAAPDRFLQCSEDGHFTDASESWGTQTESPGRGLGIVVGNLDGELGNEIFVANDMTNNHYWSRSGDAEGRQAWSLVESAMLRGVGGDDRGIPQGSMGIATGDLDGDGDLDLYVTNFDKEYNTLHSQTSSGIWQDRTRPAGLVADTVPLVAFGTEAIDIDNSGDLEIVVTNGHVDLFSRGDEKALYAQPMQIFQRSSSGRYHPVATESLGEYFASDHVGRGLWTLDANRDGRMDFAVTHQTEPTALLVNHSPGSGNWIRLDLKGRTSSRGAVGSTVRIETDQERRTAFRVAGDGYQCSNDPVLHVGLGQVDDESVTVVVTWPTGVVQRFTEIPTRRETVLVEVVK
jgi:tetratricopeptide (TPR) repeat protein